MAVLTIGAAGCSQKATLSDEVEGASPAALNSNPQITNFGVYAQNSATLRDRVVLSGGDVGVRVKGSGPFLVSGYELALVAGVQVDTTHNTIANRVLLQGAKVGDVQANTLTVQNGGTYTKKYAFPTTMPALPTLAPVFPGTAALTVNASSTVVASPGAYSAVGIGTKGILRLKGGVYHVASLQLDDDARIEALAPVQVRVAGRVSGRLSTLARVWIGAATGVTLTAADLRIEVSGKNGSGGGLTETPKAAVFGNDATILGVILVPNGTLQMGQRNTVTGALVGRDVYVDMDSKVNFQSGAAVLKCAQFCNDGNPCTKDTCTGEVCSYPSVASGTSCSDGNTCNGAETCDGAGKCKAGTPVSCTALDQCHTAGVCDPTTGMCSNPAKADGTSCNDANACTVSDICRGGICSGTTYSCDDGLACTTDTCNGNGGCSYTVTAGNCAINGACYAAGATNPTNSCQQCTPATSQTAWSLKSNGAACNDGNACTKNDVCTGGGCAGTLYGCDDGLACTADVCNGDGTCSHPVAAGSCFISGACYASGAANPANQCQQCTPATSQTAWSAKTNGTVCNDGNSCTKNDVCAAGACGGTPYSCDDGLACTADACQGDGSCTHTIAAGNCAISGACYAGGAANPANTCQVCNPAQATTWSNRADGTSCNDGNGCTQTDTCLAGTCTGSNPVVCTASDQCHDIGTCDSTTGKCSNPAKADGSPCNDGSACTQTDTCHAGVCTGSNPVVCTAMDQCHTAGVCDPAFGCSNPALPNGTSCNDNRACTTGDVCNAGICAGTVDSSPSNSACLGANQGLGYASPQRHPLPYPPLKNGCYAGTRDGSWFAVPCGSSTELENGHPEVSRGGVVVPAANHNNVSYVFAQAESMIVHTDKQTDVLASNPDLDNAWSLQLNTNSFDIGATGTDKGLIQFFFGKFTDPAKPNDPADSAICVYPVVWSTTGGGYNYNHKCLATGNFTGAPVISGGKLADFDYVNLAGFAFDDNSTPAQHKLATVVQFSMVGNTAVPDALAVNQIPGLYAVVDDDPGLAGHWWAANGGIMGKFSGSEAEFTNAEVLTTIAASNCPGDTSATGVTCPSLADLSSANTTLVGDYCSTGDECTGESDNLTLIRNPVLTYPNRNLVVTQILSSDYTSGGTPTCLASLKDDVFIKDNDADHGGIPSNSGGVPFWESPDIFILPATAAAPQFNDVAADFQVTLGQDYYVYLRVNNDFGCAGVSNIKVIIDAADPSIGFASWSPVTLGADTNQFVAAPGNPTVPAFDKAIIGPFPWKPSTSLSGGHKCLKAAIVGGSQAYPFQPGTTALWPETYSSHQIAQRNIQVTNGSTCDYAISNTSANAANLLLGVNVTPLSSLAGSVIKLTFDDNATYDWYAVWTNQAARPPANLFTVAKGTGPTPTTILTLNTGSIALDTVSVSAGISPHVYIDITTTASPVPNVAISSRLEDPMYHTILLENGGSCQASQPILSCAPGLTLCGSKCVDLNTDGSNCGSCGYQCPGTSYCLGGQCYDNPR